MPVAVLTRLVHIEAVTSVLDRGYRQTGRPKQRQDRDDQGRFTTAGPANDSQDLQIAAFNLVGAARYPAPRSHPLATSKRGAGRPSDNPNRLPMSARRRSTASFPRLVTPG